MFRLYHHKVYSTISIIAIITPAEEEAYIASKNCWVLRLMTYCIYNLRQDYILSFRMLSLGKTNKDAMSS